MVKSVLAALLCFVANVATAATLQGLVVGVADGDTVTILGADRGTTVVRLAGIDAPEKRQAFGSRSKQALSNLVYGKHVVVEFKKADQYGRVLGKVVVNGVDANLEQLRTGMAWHYKRYEKDQAPSDRQTYAAAENRAREGNFGLWSDGSPTPPWDFRMNQKREN